MYDFSKPITKFHEDDVRLTNAQRANMRGRRQANLDRIQNGLRELNKPAFCETINQGGYAQKTMTQPPEADQESRYDIDLGVVFEEEDAGSPRTTRGWVRDAIARKATNMKNEPETKKKCVRVIYADGYQCDFPVFRRRWTGEGWLYDLSSGDEWVASDPRSMNTWIDNEVSANSPEAVGSYQLRRVIRLGKFFAKTHANRLNLTFPGGLVATALFIECYVPILGRDDQSFRETLRAVSRRSKYAAVYANGVEISDEKDTKRIGRLIEEAEAAVKELDKLDVNDATESDARMSWKKVFRHSFFNAIANKTASTSSLPSQGMSVLGGLGLAAPFIASQAAAALSESEKLERLESAVRTRTESGPGGKPWSES